MTSLHFLLSSPPVFPFPPNPLPFLHFLSLFPTNPSTLSLPSFLLPFFVLSPAFSFSFPPLFVPYIFSIFPIILLILNLPVFSSLLLSSSTPSHSPHLLLPYFLPTSPTPLCPSFFYLYNKPLVSFPSSSTRNYVKNIFTLPFLSSSPLFLSSSPPSLISFYSPLLLFSSSDLSLLFLHLLTVFPILNLLIHLFPLF